MLGLVFEKMVDRLVVARKEEDDSRRRKETVPVSILPEEESGEDQDKEDNEVSVDEREI